MLHIISVFAKTGTLSSLDVTDTWPAQAQKFGGDQQLDLSDDELGEDSVLLESPLDKLEPYQIFRSALMSELILLLTEHPPGKNNGGV